MTVADDERAYLAGLLGVGENNSLGDLRRAFYAGLLDGSLSLGGASPEEIQTAVDQYLTANPPSGVSQADIAAAVDQYFIDNPPPSGGGEPTTDASLLTSGTLAAARLPAEAVLETELTTALAGKAATVHTHATSDITSLQTYVDGRVNTRVDTLVNGAPAALDTLQEIAARLEAESTEADAILAAVNLKAPIANPTFTGTVGGITKAMVGLGNVDNTSDANKPVSTAQQTAIDAKAPALVLFSVKTTSYTLALADGGAGVETNLTTANTITVPPNSSVAYPIGTIIALRQYGTGQTTVAPGAGVIIRSRDNALKFSGQYSEAALTKRSTDEWILSGDVIA